MTTEVNTSYHDELVDYVKLVGEYIQEHAKELVQNVSGISSLTISATFDPKFASIPEISVSAEFVPDPAKVYNIYDKYHNSKEKEN